MTQGHGRWAHFWPLTTWRTFAIITSVISNGSSLSENYVSGFIEWFSVVIFDGGWWFRWIRSHCTRTIRHTCHCTACNRTRIRGHGSRSGSSEWVTLNPDPLIWSWLLQPNVRWRPQPATVSAKCIYGIHPGRTFPPAIDHKIPSMWFSCNKCEGH